MVHSHVQVRYIFCHCVYRKMVSAFLAKANSVVLYNSHFNSQQENSIRLWMNFGTYQHTEQVHVWISDHWTIHSCAILAGY